LEVEVVPDKEYGKWLAAGLKKAIEQNATQISVVADISSLSRVRIAHFISTLRNVPLEVDVTLDVVYCLASYVAVVAISIQIVI
jgi:hypothetical protein